MSVEEPVAHLSQELVQFGSGGVDQLGSSPTQHGPAEPERQAGGHRGCQGAGEAEEAGDGEEEPLLSARHGGRSRSEAAGAGAGGPEEAASPQNPHSRHLRSEYSRRWSNSRVTMATRGEITHTYTHTQSGGPGHMEVRWRPPPVRTPVRYQQSCSSFL